MTELKRCKSCERDLPKNTDYYFKNNRTKDGYLPKCKECQGGTFTSKLTKIPKEGFKFCAKCDRELKVNNKYFPEDKTCKDGYRNVCRECGKDGHFMTDEYIKNPKRVWDDEENNLFIERYPHYTNEELIEIFYSNETFKKLVNRADRLSVNKSKETIQRTAQIRGEKFSGINSHLYGIPKSEETKRKLSKARKSKCVGKDNYWYGRKCSEDFRAYMSKLKKGNWAGDSNPRAIDPLFGERNGRWQGGITPENAKLRSSDEYFGWRISVFERDNYTCQCCGNRNKLEAHHILNFSTNEELRFDVNNGITFCRDCHNPIVIGSFHHIYGTKNNTYEQILDFMKDNSWSIKTKKKVVLEAVIL